jgi:hypothetical protein
MKILTLFGMTTRRFGTWTCDVFPWEDDFSCLV